MDQEVQQLISELEAAIKEITNAVTNFPEYKREEALFGKWSLKDVMAHYCGWNLLTIKELGMLISGKPPINWIKESQLDAFNKYEVEKRSAKSWTEIYEEFVKSWQDLVDKYKSLDEDHWKSQYGPGVEDTPHRSINLDIEHIQEHLVEIEQLPLI